MAHNTQYNFSVHEYVCVGAGVCMCHLDFSICVFAGGACHIPLAEGLRGAGWTWSGDVQLPIRVLRQVTRALTAWYQRPRDLEVT